MRLFFANSAFVKVPERLIVRGGKWQSSGLWVRYGLIIHPTMGAVLIDTGYTFHCTRANERSIGLRAYNAILRPELIDAGQPNAFLARFNLAPSDINYVIITHFHADHISGLSLFTKARFVACEHAWETVCKASYFGNLRHGIFPELVPKDFKDRFQPLSGKPTVETELGINAKDIFADQKILALPLPGHAIGHFGVILRMPEKSVLYAVDTQWLFAALPDKNHPGFPSRCIASNKNHLSISSRVVERFRDNGLGDVVLSHDPVQTPYDIIDVEKNT